MPEALPPGSTIGILGGGQLGRMLALAAARLGLQTHIYSDEPNVPAFEVSAYSTVGLFEDGAALGTFAASVDVVTCEFENVPARALEIAGGKAPVHPPAKSFAVAQDRLAEKNFIRGLGIPVADYADAHDEQSLLDALASVGLPSLLKTRRFGYDGKGQALVRSEKEAVAALKELGGQPALIEHLVAFEREISVIVVRGQDGGVKFYDPVENLHQNGILAISRAPARISADCGEDARRIAGKVAEALGHVGVLCVEMFQRESETPRLLVNEIAPRVHNSGHWTIDACLVSQFENHIRAIAGWPLGDTERHSDAVMTNLIGADVSHWRELAGETDVAVHLYGKAEARPGRKMGHTTRIFPKSS
ncbi:MAG TPA: 5-(carboxyamino)imidazole ribonucleotide synthase [Methyloceanibacter sp.]|jgi:5-(carboxyamino)imidazole ribonucleotide synthase|nr:5-(carboxyamino)imidazole ribonucleotide synthase [Methyloceanibacter sp.]